MPRSLVGSEMCIRDRCKIRPAMSIRHAVAPSRVGP